ncbi:MAG: DNA polymerase III subunit beta, partial [Gammaproteobacteria bacterium]
MEILVDKDDWVGALQTTSGIVERKHTKPILANVLITV